MKASSADCHEILEGVDRLQSRKDWLETRARGIELDLVQAEIPNVKSVTMVVFQWSGIPFS